MNPHVGFILGWTMFLEYLFQPIQNALYAVLAIRRLVPQIPFAVLAAVIVGLITLMTVQGIKFNARTNEVLLGFMALGHSRIFGASISLHRLAQRRRPDCSPRIRSTIPPLSICAPWQQEHPSPRWYSSDSTASRFSPKK